MVMVTRTLNNVNVHFDLPHRCIYCDEKMTPEIVTSLIDDVNWGRGWLHMVNVYRCSNDACRKYFTAEYYSNQASTRGTTTMILKSYTYEKQINLSIPPLVRELSPRFADIYTQAAKAEAYKLAEVAGVGYRKAVEILVKDYAVHIKDTLPNQKDKSDEQIFQMSFNNVVQEFLNDWPLLSKLYDKARKIGNDETHYFRKYEQHDIQDLVNLTKAIVAFIDSVLYADEFDI